MIFFFIFSNFWRFFERCHCVLCTYVHAYDRPFFLSNEFWGTQSQHGNSFVSASGASGIVPHHFFVNALPFWFGNNIRFRSNNCGFKKNRYQSPNSKSGLPIQSPCCHHHARDSKVFKTQAAVVDVKLYL